MGIIQCGSFTTDASGNATVALGWEPQYLLTKASSAVSQWPVMDTMREFIASGGGKTSSIVNANTSSAEIADAGPLHPTANGFKAIGTAPSVTFIYLAIRRPNKPPTTGTQVYNAIARTGTGAAAVISGVGFAPDTVLIKSRSVANQNLLMDRLRGSNGLVTNQTWDEAGGAGTGYITSYNMDGVTQDAASFSNTTGVTYINHFFKRAVGFFDQVCYTGTGSATTVAHGLGVVPELIIVKSRIAPVGDPGWVVYTQSAGVGFFLRLNQDASRYTATATYWNSASPTSSVFSIGDGNGINGSSTTYVAYLFATLPGISKVGSYTGNGTTQTIPCGFTTGSRFILIKRTDAAGDWKVFDHARGIISANDPHLALNTTAAEITTDDSVDPDVSGFIVNNVAATNLNVLNGQYIFLAIS